MVICLWYIGLTNLKNRKLFKYCIASNKLKWVHRLRFANEKFTADLLIPLDCFSLIRDKDDPEIIRDKDDHESKSASFGNNGVWHESIWFIEIYKTKILEKMPFEIFSRFLPTATKKKVFLTQF